MLIQLPVLLPEVPELMMPPSTAALYCRNFVPTSRLDRWLLGESPYLYAQECQETLQHCYPIVQAPADGEVNATLRKRVPILRDFINFVEASNFVIGAPVQEAEVSFLASLQWKEVTRSDVDDTRTALQWLASFFLGSAVSFSTKLKGHGFCFQRSSVHEESSCH